MATTTFTVYTPFMAQEEGRKGAVPLNAVKGQGVHYPAKGATVIAMDMWETIVYAKQMTTAFSEGKCSITMPQKDCLVHAEHPDYEKSGSVFVNFDKDRSLDLYLNEKGFKDVSIYPKTLAQKSTENVVYDETIVVPAKEEPMPEPEKTEEEIPSSPVKPVKSKSFFDKIQERFKELMMS